MKMYTEKYRWRFSPAFVTLCHFYKWFRLTLSGLLFAINGFVYGSSRFPFGLNGIFEWNTKFHYKLDCISF